MVAFKSPKFRGAEIKLTSETKYMVVYLDRKLLCNRNIQEKFRKIGKSCRLQSKVVNWNLHIACKFYYCVWCAVWLEILRMKALRKTLAKDQRCTSCTKRSTPQAELDFILHLISTEYFLVGMAARSLQRLFQR